PGADAERERERGRRAEGRGRAHRVPGRPAGNVARPRGRPVVAVGVGGRQHVVARRVEGRVTPTVPTRYSPAPASRSSASGSRTRGSRVDRMARQRTIVLSGTNEPGGRTANSTTS